MEYKDIIQNPDFKKLLKLQNHPAHQNTDILTICGFMRSADELKNHREECATDAINWNIEKRVRNPMDLY